MMPKPRIIPVLDVMNNQVVRAVGGKRAEYRPVVSKLTSSTRPVEVAKALLDVTGAVELYVADLDAITGTERSGRGVANLADCCNVRVYADMGLRTKDDFATIPRRVNVVPVLGCETLASPDTVLRAGFDWGSHWAFSLDMFNGRLLGNWKLWETCGVRCDEDVGQLAAAVVLNGQAETVILIDLADVGQMSGPSTEFWCQRLQAALPGTELLVGGGVRSWDDVERLGAAGATGVLVASALHQGTLIFPPPHLLSGSSVKQQTPPAVSDPAPSDI